ncbi:hypothetical protein BDQ17DRAFT_1390567 [Cyathus striatus]|nr:hypothetical protein BDQ17DRAFT_1390567 [Cyathus striatus]
MASSSQLAQPTPNAPHLLLCEILGFSPQLLLDDIINIANNAVQDGVNGMEEFLYKWVDERAASRPDDWDPTNDIEQGLVSFQTLLEYHTDIAFDFFEADLPTVLPHQEGLNLEISPEKEQALMDDVEKLRGQLENVGYMHQLQRRLNRLLQQSVQRSATRLERARKLYAQLAPLSRASNPALSRLANLPEKLQSLFDAASSIPPLDPSLSVPPSTITEPGKRAWESHKTGYLHWAVDRLEIGAAQELSKAKEVVESVQNDLQDVMEE